MSRVAPGDGRVVMAAVAGAIACQVLLLAIVGYSQRNMLNPDAVAYLRLADHYAQGEFRLAVSGYWGPMLTWWMVPFLALHIDPLVTARLVMGLTAVLFLLGSVSVIRAFQLGPIGTVVGAWLVAIASVPWSIENITPDLLMGGVLCFAIGRLLSARWTESPPFQFLTGLLFGVAYLTKAIALPITVALTLAFALCWRVADPARSRTLLRSASVTLIGFLAIAGPWIVVLSVKYQTPTFSTTGRVAHAIVGPTDIIRDPEITSFHVPEPGRLTSWEDPSVLRYLDWSPFENFQYFKHQLSLVYHNGGRMLTFFAGFDFFHLGLVAALLGLIVHTPWRHNMARERWRWAAVPVVCLCVFYLPVYAGGSGDERYYYPSYPFIVAATIGMVMSLTRTASNAANLSRIAGIALVVVSFIQTPALRVIIAARGKDDTTLARSLGSKLTTLGRAGEIAAVGSCLGQVPPSFVAFFTKTIFRGCEANSTLTRVKGSGARIIIVDRRLPLNRELEADPQFENLDPLLFKSPEEAGAFPAQVFEMRRAAIASAANEARRDRPQSP